MEDHHQGVGQRWPRRCRGDSRGRLPGARGGEADGSAEQPVRFEAAPGEWVVLTGADRLTGWAKAPGENPVYTVAWPYRFNTYSKTMTHPGDAYHRVIGRCGQVFVNGYALRQVLSAGQLAPGSFFADVTNQLLQDRRS